CCLLLRSRHLSRCCGSYRDPSLVRVALAEELANAGEPLYMIAHYLERRQHRDRDERAGDPPDLPPERDSDENRDGIERQPMPHHRRADEVALDKIQSDEAPGHYQRVRDVVEHGERCDGEYRNERERADIRYELETGYKCAPQKRVRHLEQIHDAGEHGTLGEIEQRRRHEVPRYRSLDLPRDFYSRPLARCPRRNLYRLLQKEIARREQEEEQHEHLEQRSDDTLRRSEKARPQARPGHNNSARRCAIARYAGNLVHLLGGARHLLHRLHDLVELVAGLLERRRRGREPPLRGRRELVHAEAQAAG